MTGGFVHPRRAVLFVVVFTLLIGMGRLTGHEALTLIAVVQVMLFGPKIDVPLLRRQWRQMRGE